jgi:hypothetical protein
MDPMSTRWNPHCIRLRGSEGYLTGVRFLKATDAYALLVGPRSELVFVAYIRVLL